MAPMAREAWASPVRPVRGDAGMQDAPSCLQQLHDAMRREQNATPFGICPTNRALFPIGLLYVLRTQSRNITKWTWPFESLALPIASA